MKKLQNYTGYRTWFVALLVGALAAGCGGGRDPILGPVNVANIAPTVTSVIPAAGATGVAINTKTITAAFSKAMDPATLTPTSFALACPAGTPVTGTVTYAAAGNVATLTLPAAAPNLPFDTLCTATVSTAAKDTTGLALASNFAWTFRTAPDTTRPTVTRTTPATTTPGPTLNVQPNTAINAVFSKDMDSATIGAASFTLTGPGVTPVLASAPPSYASRIATFHPSAPLTVGVTYTATITTSAKDVPGNALASNYVWTFTVVADTTPPTVTAVNPNQGDTGVCLRKPVSATFSEPMDSATVNNISFTLQPSGPPLGATAGGTVTMNPANRIATFTPTSDLIANSDYTATITTAAKDQAGNALASSKVWTFRTGALACSGAVPVSPIDLGTAVTYGTFGGTAGMTNKGIQTIIQGSSGNTADIGTIATDTSAVTGFQDSALDVYTVVPGVNQGLVTGKIFTCTTSTTGPTNPTNGVNAASCAKATQALLDARATYLELAGMPVSGLAAPANLANQTLAPGVYKAPSGSFMIQGGDLTLDAQGDSSATWVFQMATTLTVGGPGAAAPQSVILTNGALAKNVFWQVGSAAIINAAGGGTMVGTIISEAGAAFSTAGNVIPVTMNGRALSLGASVTLVNTIITVPAP